TAHQPSIRNRTPLPAGRRRRPRAGERRVRQGRGAQREPGGPDPQAARGTGLPEGAPAGQERGGQARSDPGAARPRSAGRRRGEGDRLMRGGFLHNDAMAERLRATLTKLGARFWTEHPAGPGRRAGAVDIYAELGRSRIAIEIELGPRRIHQDLEKALALDVDLLLVVAPTATVARAIRRRLVTIRPNRP